MLESYEQASFEFILCIIYRLFKHFPMYSLCDYAQQTQCWDESLSRQLLNKTSLILFFSNHRHSGIQRW